MREKGKGGNGEERERWWKEKENKKEPRESHLARFLLYLS